MSDYQLSEVQPMTRRTKTITFSLPPEMAETVQDVMREEDRTMSELIREALRNYIDDKEWLRATRRERLKAREAKRSDADGRTTG